MWQGELFSARLARHGVHNLPPETTLSANGLPPRYTWQMLGTEHLTEQSLS